MILEAIISRNGNPVLEDMWSKAALENGSLKDRLAAVTSERNAAVKDLKWLMKHAEGNAVLPCEVCAFNLIRDACFTCNPKRRNGMNMTAREAIGRLEMVLYIAEGNNPKFSDIANLYEEEDITALRMAIAALQASVPRVLAKKSLKSYDLPYVCLEIYARGTDWIPKSGAEFLVNTVNEPEQRLFRLWTLSPSSEQMANTTWEEETNEQA
jgi:hypothetical protein